MFYDSDETLFRITTVHLSQQTNEIWSPLLSGAIYIRSIQLPIMGFSNNTDIKAFTNFTLRQMPVNIPGQMLSRCRGLLSQIQKLLRMEVKTAVLIPWQVVVKPAAVVT